MVYTLITSGMMVLTVIILDGKKIMLKEAWSSKFSYGLFLLIFLILIALYSIIQYFGSVNVLALLQKILAPITKWVFSPS
nr:hypothetical protein [Bacilli bacterium]